MTARKKKPGRGRRTVLNDEIVVVDNKGKETRTTVRQLIIDSITAGAWDYIAAESAKVDQKTFYSWMKKGADAGLKASTCACGHPDEAHDPECLEQATIDVATHDEPKKAIPHKRCDCNEFDGLELSERERDYFDFRQSIQQARARARMVNEIARSRKSPGEWLDRGPGKDRPGRPGWGQTMQHQLSITTLRQLVEEVAKETGQDADELMAAAEAIAAGRYRESEGEDDG